MHETHKFSVVLCTRYFWLLGTRLLFVLGTSSVGCYDLLYCLTLSMQYKLVVSKPKGQSPTVPVMLFIIHDEPIIQEIIS